MPHPTARRGVGHASAVRIAASLVTAALLASCAGTRPATPTEDPGAILAKLPPEERRAVAKDAFLDALWLDLQGQGLMAMDMLQEAAWSDPDDRWLQFALAAKLREFRRSSEALALVRRALRLPGDETPDQWGLSAGLWLEAGARDSAQACWKRMLELDPEAREALIGLATLAEARGDLAEAASHYAALSEQYGENGGAITNRAVNLWARAGFLDSATALLDRRWNSWANPEEGATLARLLASRGLTDSAVALYDRLAADPDAESSHLRLLAARTLMLSGRVDSARARLRDLSLQGFTEAQLTLGALLLDLDSLQAARALFLPQVHDIEHGALACHYLGLIAARSDQIDSARSWFDKALALDPKRPDTWSRRGLIELDADQSDSACRIFARMAKLWPASSQARWLLGHALVRKAETESVHPSWAAPAPDSEPAVTAIRLEALAAFDTAIALDPGHPRARFEHAALQERLGRRTLAIRELRSIVQGDSANAMACNYLAYMLAEDSLDLDEASLLVGIALQADSASTAYLDTRGWIRFRQGRFAEGLADVENAIAQGEDDAVVLEHRARILERIGPPERVREAWQAVLRKAPDHTRARAALGQTP